MDAGLETVEYIYKTMMVDEEWSVREERGFTWWAGPLAQRVWAEPPRESMGLLVSKVSIQTKMLKNVQETTEMYRRLGEANMFASLSALSWDRSSQCVTYNCNGYVHQDNFPWIRRLLTTAAGMQVASAETGGEFVNELIGAEIDSSLHPLHGPRTKLDEITRLIEEIISPKGQEENSFTATEFMAAHQMEPRPWNVIYDSSSADTLVAEIPFLGEKAAMDIGLSGSRELPETALLQALRGWQHPQLGNGALISIRLPFIMSEKDIMWAAQLYNSAEWVQWTGNNMFGSWCMAPGQKLAFVCFLPSACHIPGLLENILFAQRLRLKWLYEWLKKINALDIFLGQGEQAK